jgi:hypothetical protein
MEIFSHHDEELDHRPIIIVDGNRDAQSEYEDLFHLRHIDDTIIIHEKISDNEVEKRISVCWAARLTFSSKYLIWSNSGGKSN